MRDRRVRARRPDSADDDLGSLGPAAEPGSSSSGDLALVGTAGSARTASGRSMCADPLHGGVEVGRGQRHEHAARCDEADADTAAACRCAIVSTAARPGVLPAAQHHDVAGLQVVRATSTTASRSATRRADARRRRTSCGGTRRCRRRGSRPPRSRSGQHLLAPLEAGFEPHDVAVGLVLRERQVQQVVRLIARVGAHEVGGHVVRRPERRGERERSARRKPGDLVEGHERRPQHDRVADRVDASPPGATGELRVLARRQELVALARELRELLDDDGTRRHVDAEREGLGREDDLDEPFDEAGLDGLLERRHHAPRDGRRCRPRVPPAIGRSRARRGRRRSRPRSRAPTISRMRSRSAAVVSRRPASRHAAAASSHAARLKMK